MQNCYCLPPLSPKKTMKNANKISLIYRPGSTCKSIKWIRLWSRKAYYLYPPFADGLRGKFHPSLLSFLSPTQLYPSLGITLSIFVSWSTIYLCIWREKHSIYIYIYIHKHILFIYIIYISSKEYGIYLYTE